jgi:2-phospho-L-lactate guanylyltransferase (CobY/MobA/RfbA family)
MKRMKAQDVVQDVKQALDAVQADEVVVIQQEDGDNLVLITQQHFEQLLGGQRNPDVIIRELAGGQRNPDAVMPEPAKAI